MTIFGPGLAMAYDRLFGDPFAEAAGPPIQRFYAPTPIAQTNRAVLDIGCGSGQLACYLLEQGYHVTGIDISDNMLERARRHAQPYIEAGQAAFLQADVTQLVLPQRFGLIVSTFEVFNHLSSDDELAQTFRNIFGMLADGGYFIFDLLTNVGIQRWQGADLVYKQNDLDMIVKGAYDGHSRWATMRFAGTITLDDGRSEDFDETIREMAFDSEAVMRMLLRTGWHSVYFAHRADLSTPITLGDQDHRISVVAWKSDET
jgi:SAM-dependent methyltransferase